MSKIHNWTLHIQVENELKSKNWICAYAGATTKYGYFILNWKLHRAKVNEITLAATFMHEIDRNDF